MWRLSISTALLCACTASPIALVTFDGSAATTHKFTELNDPVMGGQSSGTWSVGNGFGILDGQVIPGFPS